MWTLADFATIVGTILTLVVLEGLLSTDNALVLAVMVRHLPKPERKRALRYGILGAFLFRFVAVLFAATLLDYWQLKVVGGCYLLYLAVSHLVFGESDEAAAGKTAVGRGLWGTVVAVELADIAFSIDSILAAVAMADSLPPRLGNQVLWLFENQVWVVYVGGVLGIITMRFVAGFFLILLERFNGLEAGAYYLVGWIGLKLIGGGGHDALNPRLPVAGGWRATLPGWVRSLPLDMPEWFFWGGMGMIVLISLVRSPKRAEGPPGAAELEQFREVLDSTVVTPDSDPVLGGQTDSPAGPFESRTPLGNDPPTDVQE